MLNLDNDETAALQQTLDEVGRPTAWTTSARISVAAGSQACAGRDCVQRASSAEAAKRSRCGFRCRAGTMSPTRWPRSPRRARCGVSLKDAAEALEGFSGIRRRLEVVGTANGVTVIDDFAHNPDKIAATLATLHDFPGPPAGDVPAARLRPAEADEERVHRLLRRDLSKDDVLIMPEPVYFGGTVDRSVTSGGHRAAASRPEGARRTAFPTAPPAATSWWSWRGPATASS